MKRARFAHHLLAVLAASLTLTLAGCGGNSSPASPTQTPGTPGTTSGTPTATAVPVVQHVAVVMLENQGFTTATDSTSMPYLNGLIHQGSLAANYYADAHPSLPNYFMLTTGQTLVTEDASPVQNVDNVVRVLSAAGKSWKGYFQSLPSVGYMGLDVPPYVKHHNPFAYLSDVVNSASQQQNIVPLSSLASDAASSHLPNYMFIVPDDAHSGGECPDGSTSCPNSTKVATADAWLKDTVGTLLASSQFQQSGVLVITFDEANIADTTNGGGHVVAVIVGTKVKAGYQSSTTFQHQSTLRFTLQALGLSSFPGSASGAAEFTQFFQP